MNGVQHIHPASQCHGGLMTGKPVGQNTIKNVDSTQNAIDQIFRRTTPIRYRGLYDGRRGTTVSRTACISALLSPTEGLQWPIRQRLTGCPFGGTFSQVIKHAALHNAEQCLIFACFSPQTAFRPRGGSLERLFVIQPIIRWGAFIKSHDDIRS
jgi:hypothetical protein